MKCSTDQATLPSNGHEVVWATPARDLVGNALLLNSVSEFDILP